MKVDDIISYHDVATAENWVAHAPRVLAGDSRLGPQMVREPLGGGLRRAVELVGVSREVTAGVELQPLRLAGAVKRRQGEVGGADDVGVAEYHEERGRRDALDECAGLVLRVHLERPQRDL